MQKKESKTFAISTIIYVTMLIIMICIWVSLSKESKASISNPIDISIANEITDIKWYDSVGNIVQDINDLYLLKENGEIYCILPESLEEGRSLCFRSKHTVFSVYFENELIYEQELPESKLYTNSNGATWNTVPLLSSYAGGKITIKYELCYDESGCGFDGMCITSGKDFILDILRSKTSALALSFAYMVLGIILVIADLIINKKLNQPHSLFYLGFIAITVAAYCLVETQVFQIFISDQKIMHLLSIFSMMAVPIPVLMYAETLFEFKLKYTSVVLSVISFLIFIVTTILNVTNVMDYHESMVAIHIALFGSFAMMLYSMVIYFYRVHKKQEEFDYYILFMVAGLVIIILCGAVDVIRFYTVKTLDPALFTRAGFLGTIICFVFASSRRIIEVFKTNTRMEFVTKLAYEDGLTGLANRTAYKERLEEFSEKGSSYGIVILDINNLKHVNDSFGHIEGDRLLISASKMIKEAFASQGTECFRTGGDEFAVLIKTNDIEKDCKDKIKTLEALYREYNKNEDCKYQIVIAKGFSVYEPERGVTQEEVIQKADELMYENKQMLKNICVSRE